ncbi:hypothetical protein, conserved [Leishmania donovani]|uniref:Uncharacterized protein n=1 Tax=Leishmania donovani TaxID=5661 RepID=E9B7S1_LEIDO|nr:hypothetical protein, conserved [Leishmania donovani]CBZ31294.1 hypothetical protein, conserved [Leishmania donovani]
MYSRAPSHCLVAPRISADFFSTPSSPRPPHPDITTKEGTMATAAAEAACVTCSTALCSSSTLSVDPMKRRSGSHRMDKTTPASRSEGSACTASYSGSAVLAEHHRTRPSVHGFGRGDSREARWTHRPRRALRLTKRAAVCVLYLLLPFLLYHSTPPSASQRLPPARASITAATASICAPFLFVRAVEYDLTLAFQTNDYVDNVCVPGATAARTSLRAPPTAARGSAMKEAAVAPTASTAPAAAIDLSACPYYPLWSLLAGVSSFGETARVDGGNVDAAAASRAGARGGVDSSTRPVERHGRAAAAEAEAEARRRIPTATSAAAPSAASTAYVVPGDLTSTLSGSRNALTYYYQVLNTDDFFFMLQGCTIQITIDGDVPPSYAYNSFQRYADAYALNVSATGKDGSISGGSGGRGSLAFPAGTRASDTEGDGDEAYPNITLRTAFFFWNQPRLHCAYNAPALMSMMVDLANQHHHHQQQQQQRRAFLKDDAVLAEASAQPADGEVAAGRPVASSAGPLYPSCAASMPPPKNILPSGGRNTTLTVNYMQLGSSVVVKIFSFDVWYQLTGTPAPATLSKARTTTTAAPASAAYSAVFSSGPITRGRGCSTGVSTKNLAAGQSLKLPADPEKVCTAPALYTISLNPLLARASSWSLGSSTDWLQPSVMVTHDYPAARVIAVVAQCSGVPLSFSVKANFLNPGNYPGSGQHYATSIIHLFFLVCYALLLIVFLVMIVPCSKRRRRRRRGQGRQRRGGGAEGGESSSSPGQARSSDKKKRASAGSDKSRGGSMRGRRSGSAAAGGDGGEEMHGTSAPSSTTTKYAAVAASSGPESTSAAVKNTTTAQRSPSSSSPTSAAAVAARTRASAQRGATESGQDNAEDEPLHREEGKSGRRQHRGGAGPRPQQQRQGQRVAERRNGGSEGDDSQPETSSLYTAHSNAHLTSSSGIYDDNDINCGSSDAASEVQARRGSSGRRRAQSRRRGGPSTLSLSTSGDDSDCSSSSSTTTTTATDSTSDDDDSRAARRRRRQKEQRRAKRERQEQKKQRSRPRHHVSATSTSRRYAANDLDDDRRGSSTGVVSAFASPLRWRFRAVGMTDVVGHQVLDPVRLWWAESHILVMYAPIQWLVLVLLVLRCLLSVLLAAKFFLLSRAVHRDSLMGNSLSLVCIIFEVATDTLLIPIEMLVAMGWGLAFTAPLPTNQIVTVGLATLTMFIVFVFSAACAKDGLSMALTANRYARLINGNLCNTVAYTRAAFEMVCRVHNVLRMFLLSLWLSKTVVPADAAAVQRQRRLSHRQLQGAQNECREGQGMAGPGDSSSDGVSCRSDLHRRTSSATSSSSSGQCDGSSLVTTFTTTDTTTPSSAPFALRPPPRLGYPGVSLSAMEVYLRYRGMWVPFAMLLVWAVLLLVFAFTFYEPEDYYMVVAFRELQSVYLLGFIILFLRTSSPLYC